jgi:putative ABC transport system ATP-binding protein
MSILEAIDLIRTYTIGDQPARVVDRVSLAVGAGEFLVIAGESGSGKTTLLSLLSGLDRPTSGRVLIGGTDITDMDEESLAPFRNATFGFVFQAFHLVPSLSALENVMFPAELRRDPEAGRKAMVLLKRVGLTGRAGNLPHQLSGGEKQRVAICRALVNQPPLIFADEPTGNLDSANGAAVLELLLDLRREHGSALVMVTHSRDIADRADRVITLRDGAVVDDTRPDGPRAHDGGHATRRP